MILAAHFHGAIPGDVHARLVQPLAVAVEHLAGDDQGLRLGARLRQPALHQQRIQPLPPRLL